MIADSSALIAILNNEPEATAFARLLYSDRSPRISAAGFFEAAIVLDRAKSPVPGRRLDDLLMATGMVIEPVTEEQARIAREAYRDYGRGSGHPAKLNYGDCFAYALARATGAPLLFKGNDFIHTDIEPALK